MEWLHRLFSRNTGHTVPAATYGESLHTANDERIMELEREIAESRAKIASYRTTARLDNRPASRSAGRGVPDLKALSSRYDDTDHDDLQAHIDDLEDMLDDYDVLSDGYENIENEIDRLQTRLDAMENRSHGVDYIDLIHRDPDYYLNGGYEDNDTCNDFDRGCDYDTTDDEDW